MHYRASPSSAEYLSPSCAHRLLLVAMSAFRASSVRLAGAFRPTARAAFLKGVPQAHVGEM